MRSILKIFAAAAIAVTLSFGAAFANGFGNDGYIEVEGVAYPEPGQSLNNLRRVAIMDAYRYLAEEVDSLHITSTTTVIDARANDEINSAVDAILKGTRVTKVYRDTDGSFHAIARLPVYGAQNSLANVVMPKEVVREEIPKPKFTNMVVSAQTYTGLILDCRGKNISSALAPAIKSSDGTKIYSFEQVDRQDAVSRGMVDYSDNINSGVERAGSNPLIVKAESISNACDIVISADDADKILMVNQSAQILNNCMVVIVK